MNNDPLSNKDQEATALRLENESDRTPEFKEKRDIFIATINDYLKSMVLKRDEHKPLINGTFISNRPRLITTDLGQSGPNARLMSTKIINGVSVVGDGVETKIALQAVISNPRTDQIEIIEVEGFDPLSELVHGSGFSSGRSSDIVASFGVEDSTGSYFKYIVKGNGSLEHQSFSGSFHEAKTVKDLDSIELALIAFQQTTKDLRFI